MKFNIHGKKLDVTESIKNYIEEKIGRLDKYFENPDNITATVLIKLRGNEQVVEATINANKFMLRAEESHKDLYASIDKVSDKIESFSKDRAGSLLPIRLFIHRTKPPWDYGLVGGGDENPPRDIFVLS